MASQQLRRRDLLSAATAIIAGGAASAVVRLARGRASRRPGNATRAAREAASPFILGLNTSTLRGHKLSIVEEIAIAEKAGYRGMEPWVDELERHAASGESLEDLGKRFRDAGISVESAIGFFEWIVDDPARRQKALGVGPAEHGAGRAGRGQAPGRAAGRRDRPRHARPAPRRRALSRLARAGRPDRGRPRGRGLGILADARAGWARRRWWPWRPITLRPASCPDVYHLHRGGSGLGGVKLLVAAAIHVFHFNDYPANPPREKLTDADRVYPGDGVAPLGGAAPGPGRRRVPGHALARAVQPAVLVAGSR